MPLDIIVNIVKSHDDSYKKAGEVGVQCNYNQPMPPHCDSNNIGPSYILAVGTEGTLQIHDNGEVKTYNIHNKILKFDGHSLKHSCDFTGQGTRISFVVYHRPPRGTKGVGM